MRRITHHRDYLYFLTLYLLIDSPSLHRLRNFLHVLITFRWVSCEASSFEILLPYLINTQENPLILILSSSDMMSFFSRCHFFLFPIEKENKQSISSIVMTPHYIVVTVTPEVDYLQMEVPKMIPKEILRVFDTKTIRDGWFEHHDWFTFFIRFNLHVFLYDDRYFLTWWCHWILSESPMTILIRVMWMWRVWLFITTPFWYQQAIDFDLPRTHTASSNKI